MSLSCENLRFAYSSAGKPVIDGLSARFLPGRLTAIIGANGCGKSTLMRLLLGSLQPQAGTIKLDGVALNAINPGQRARRLAYVAQRPSLSEAFTARRVVQLGRHASSTLFTSGTQDRNTPDALAVDGALRRAGATELADQSFGELSAGQQQRISLARAIAQLDRPASPTAQAADAGAVLLADEPCSAMDPRHEQHTMRLLRALCTGQSDDGSTRPPTTVIVVLHDLSVVARWCDNVLIMNPRGGVIAHAPIHQALTPASLREAFQTNFRIVHEPGSDQSNPNAKRILAIVPEDEP
ncbi:MAG: ABC transporter ATP-binding protein [Phycisphaerales bacterium]|nr:ABC transporter ATP-binding protein [Phycisphaerales bacterium]